MSVVYSIYEVPNLQSEKRTKTHQARIQSNGTVKTNELCQLISERSSVSPADVKATLDSLNFCFDYFLSRGYNVELDDLGIFSLGLKSRKIKRAEDKTVLGVTINGIHFRPSVELKAQIAGFKLERKAKKTTKQYTLEERLERIMNQVTTKGYINRKSVEELNNVSRYIANNDLQLLVDNQQLKVIGLRSGRNYILMPETV